ncbi:MAG: universal stress protein [Actinobacteria bacterium]|nr:universal stress protein [Actinomycetota bacterium]
MHVLIATDGTMDTGTAVRFATALAGPDGHITVLTVVEVNRTLLRDLRAIYGERHPPAIDQDAEYVGIRPEGGTGPDPSWPGDDEMLARYLDQQRAGRTAALEDALRAAGADVAVEAREGEDPAGAILAAVGQLEPDVMVVGSHGSGLFEGLLGSTGTKLARRSPCPVLVLRKE